MTWLSLALRPDAVAANGYGCGHPARVWLFLNEISINWKELTLAMLLTVLCERLQKLMNETACFYFN